MLRVDLRNRSFPALHHIDFDSLKVYWGPLGSVKGLRTLCLEDLPAKLSFLQLHSILLASPQLEELELSGLTFDTGLGEGEPTRDTVIGPVVLPHLQELSLRNLSTEAATLFLEGLQSSVLVRLTVTTDADLPNLIPLSVPRHLPCKHSELGWTRPTSPQSSRRLQT